MNVSAPIAPIDSIAPVAVVIPLYTLKLRRCELASLRRTLSVARNRDVVVVAPYGLDLTPLSTLLCCKPVWRVERFDSQFFAGRAGYNRLMTDSAFYRRFVDVGFDYILVCQTDVWLFADDLDRWCSAGYDYIGAPWLPSRRAVEGFWPFHRLVYHMSRLCGKSSALLKWQVGNGGLSLRRTSVLASVAERLETEIARLQAPERGSAGFEDVIWGVEVNRLEPGSVRVAPWREALQFSVESHPDYASRLLGGSLPMGTHAYRRWRNSRFWRAHLPQEAFNPDYVLQDYLTDNIIHNKNKTDEKCTK